MKKKVLAILLGALMLASMLTLPAAAEEAEWSFVVDFEKEEVANGTEPATGGATHLYAEADPTTPAGEIATNHVLKIPNAAAQKVSSPKLTFEYDSDGDGKVETFPAGVYKLSFRAYSEDNIHDKPAQTNVSLYAGNNRVWNGSNMAAPIPANTWTQYTFFFTIGYYPEGFTEFKYANLNLDNAQAKEVVYYDDFKIERVKDTFMYTTEEGYGGMDTTNSNYGDGTTPLNEALLAPVRGDIITALSGNAETIRPVCILPSDLYAEKASVIHAVYEIENGKRSLYSVDVAEVEENYRSVLISDATIVSVPAKTAEKSYELKSFLWDSASGLNSLGAASSLSVAETE